MTRNLRDAFDALASEARTEYAETGLSRDLSPVARAARRRRIISISAVTITGVVAVGGIGWAASLAVSGTVSPAFQPATPGATVSLEDFFLYLDTRATDDIGSGGAEPQRFLDCMVGEPGHNVLDEQLDSSYDPQGELLEAGFDSITIHPTCSQTTISHDPLIDATVTLSDAGDADWARFYVEWSLRNVSGFPIAVYPRSMVLNVENEIQDGHDYAGVIMDETQTHILQTDLDPYASDHLIAYSQWSREVVVLEPGASLTGEGRTDAYGFVYGIQPRDPSDVRPISADPVVAAIAAGAYTPHIIITISVAPDGDQGDRLGLLVDEVPASGTHP